MPTEISSPAPPPQKPGSEFVFHQSSKKDIESVFHFEDYPLNRMAFAGVTSIVDIGAHCGAFSYLCAHRYPDASIRSFEPLRINRELATQNFRRLPRIDLRCHGLSDYNGTADIYYSPAFGFAASSSVRTRDHNESFETSTIHKASEDLADLKSITILKIDTEGHEFRILRDMSARLASVSSIFLEIHSDEDRRSIDALLSSGFVLFYSRCDMTNRYKVAYVNSRDLEAGTIRVATAPELRP